MNNAYKDFARFYDALTFDVDYSRISVVIQRLIKRYCSGAKIVLDLACGTGNLSLKLAESGFDVIGVDLSEDMLYMAAEKARAQGLDVLFLCQDIRNIDLYGTVDCTVSTLDAINHLCTTQDIKCCFERVSLFTAPGGLFIFDMNTVYKHREVLSDQIFITEGDDNYCIWVNGKARRNNQVSISLDIFTRNSGGSYERCSDSFKERAYSLKTITGCLANTGFMLLEVFDGYTEKPPHDNSERILIVAKKI